MENIRDIQNANILITGLYKHLRDDDALHGVVLVYIARLMKLCNASGMNTKQFLKDQLQDLSLAIADFPDNEDLASQAEAQDSTNPFMTEAQRMFEQIFGDKYEHVFKPESETVRFFKLYIAFYVLDTAYTLLYQDEA